MDNTQLLVSLIAPLGTLAVVLVGFLYNNSRLSDFNERFSDLKDFVRSEVARIDEKLEAKLETIRVEMAKNHSEMLHRFADLDTRIIRIENHLGLKG